MPAITSGKVLVTGANGYLGIYVVKQLLEEGFIVRGAVRSADKIAFLKQTFASYGDKLEIAVVQDITKEGAFDEAVKGVNAIEHTASPFHFHGTHPDELIIPAVTGTSSLLQSVLKFGSTVQRIVITSSIAAVTELDGRARVFNDDHWNNHSITEVQQKGIGASHFHVYRASKTLSEREAWNFVQEHRAEIQWDLVVLNPSWVYGPSLQDITSTSALNASMALWYRYVLQGNVDKEALVTEGAYWVDIRDVSAAHVRSITVGGAGGHRILIAAGYAVWQEWVNAARKHNPMLPVGNTSYDPSKAPVPVAQIKSTKFEKLLELRYHTMEETSTAILKNLQERGLWAGEVVV